MARLTALSCFPTLVTEIGPSLSGAQKLCCDGASVPCATAPAETGLSPGGKAGVAIFVLLLIGGAGAAGFVWYKRRKNSEIKEPFYEMKTTYQVNGTELDQRTSVGVVMDL